MAVAALMVAELGLDVPMQQLGATAAMTRSAAADESSALHRSINLSTVEALEHVLSPRSPGDLLVFMDSERLDSHQSEGGRFGKLEGSKERFAPRLMPRRDSLPIAASPAPKTISKCLAIADILLESLSLNGLDVPDHDFAPLNCALAHRTTCSAASRQSNESNASESATEDVRASSRVQVADVWETRPRLDDQLQSDRSGSTTKFLKRRLSTASGRKSLVDHVWSMEVKSRFVQRHESASSAVSSITDDSCSYQDPNSIAQESFIQRIPSRRAMSFATLPHKLECDLDSALESSHLSGDSPPRSPRRSVSFSFDDSPDTSQAVAAA